MAFVIRRFLFAGYNLSKSPENIKSSLQTTDKAPMY